jgi:von Willebrand factor type A domain
LQGRVVKAVLISTCIGCGFSPGQPGEALTSSTGAGGSANSSGSGNGGVNGDGGGGGVGLSSGAGGDVGFGTGGQTCGQGSVPVMPEPPDILIVQDKSLSMSMDPTGANCAANAAGCSKWSQVSTAIESAVMATQTAVNWGLVFFGTNNMCGTSATPIVPIETNGYNDILAAFTNNQPASYTPTAAAMNAAVTYLKGLPATDTNPKFILLATDGLPNCGAAGTTADDSVNAAAAVTAAFNAGFPTFVVGIGNTMGDATLTQFAVNGGEPQTGAATQFYSVNDTADLETALSKIVGIVASCTIPLTGAPMDKTNVAISVNNSAGTPTKVPMDPTNGWSYTSAAQDTIQLNGSYCDGVKGGSYSDVQFVYSCPGGPPICIDKLANGQCGDAS